MRWKEGSTNSLSLYICVITLLISSVSIAFADEPPKDDIGFFGEIELEPTAASEHESYTEKTWSLKGFIKQKTYYSLLDRDKPGTGKKSNGFSQFKTIVDLSIDGLLGSIGTFRLNGNASADKYTNTNDNIELREAFVNVETLNNLWIKFGRQIVAWGESDYTQILDRVNPRDTSEIGLVDAEDVRIPVFATKISYVGKRWGTDLVLTHEFRSNKLAEAETDFDRFSGLRQSFDIRSGEQPDVDLANPEILWRAFKSFSSGDVSIVFASAYNDAPVLRLGNGTNELEMVHSRADTFGISGNWVYNDWLFKLELARQSNADIRSSAGPGITISKPLRQQMLGGEYAYSQDTTFSLEVESVQIEDYNTSLLPDQIRVSITNRLKVELWRDTAEIILSWRHWFQDKSDVVLFSFDYDYSDAVSLEWGYLNYIANDDRALLNPYNNDDRVFMNIRYNF